MRLAFLARLFLVALATLTPVLSAETETTDLAWEQACGGSNITVTKINGKMALIEAFAEHAAESRT